MRNFRYKLEGCEADKALFLPELAEGERLAWFPSLGNENPVGTDVEKGLWEFALKTGLYADFNTARDAEGRFNLGGVKVEFDPQVHSDFDVFAVEMGGEYGVEEFVRVNPDIKIDASCDVRVIPELVFNGLELNGVSGINEISKGVTIRKRLELIGCRELKFVDCEVSDFGNPVESFKVVSCRKLIDLPKRICAKEVVIGRCMSFEDMPEIYGCEKLVILDTGIKKFNPVTKRNILEKVEKGEMRDLVMSDELMEDLYSVEGEPSVVSKVIGGVAGRVKGLLAKFGQQNEDVSFDPAIVQGTYDQNDGTWQHDEIRPSTVISVGEAINKLKQVLDGNDGAAEIVIDGLAARVDELGQSDFHWKAFLGKLGSELSGQAKRAASDAVELAYDPNRTMVMHGMEGLKSDQMLPVLVEHIVDADGKVNDQILRNVMIMMGVYADDPALTDMRKMEFAIYLQRVMKKVGKYKEFKLRAAEIRDEEEKFGFKLVEWLAKAAAGTLGKAGKVVKMMFSLKTLIEGRRAGKWERMARED